MTDVFSISVPIVGSYPSINHLGLNGFRAGPKSESYHQLREAVTSAARIEMARTGWTTANYYVEGWITRYNPTRRKTDAGNLGKGESDFLQAAGVVLDDTLIRPLHLSTEYDPKGEDRITIVLLRRYPPMLMPAIESAPARKRMGTTSPKKKTQAYDKRAPASDTKAPIIASSELMGDCGGVPMPRSELMKMIRADSRYGGK